MLAALEAVRSGSSIKRAALEHGVPRTILYGRHTERVVHGTNPRPQPYLNKAEEAELCDFVVVVRQIGYGKTRRQIKDIAEAVAHDKGERKNLRWMVLTLSREATLSFSAKG